MSALAGDQAKVAAYLAHHRVQELVSEAINDAVLANAPNPIAHIARRLAHAAGVGDLEDGAPPDRLTSLEELSQGRRDVGGSRHEESELRLDALSAEEARLAALLIAAGQQHVFADWPPAGEESAGKRSFFAQAAALDKAYPGGLGAYLANGRKLLAAARLGANPLEGWTPAPPEGAHVLQPGTLEFDELERLGTAELGGVAFVIPAGGMGERLGYSGVKFGLPAELSSAKCVFEIYCAYILAFERAAERARPAKGPVRIPLALMVSDDTRAGIEALLEAHGCFGLHPSQICLLHQEKVACFADADGALAKRGRYELETKPHGHGDVHFLLHRAGLAQRWLSEGRKWICFFQDTSTLYLATFLATLGASFKYELEMNSVCVPRRAREAIGAMAQLTHADGRALLASVEYNQLEPLLRASGRGADVADAASGLSPYPGNINKLLFQLPTYVAALEYSKGELLEFVNPKFASGPDGSTLSTFKSPARLECMMQDFAHTLQARLKGCKVGFTQVPLDFGYYPVKNSQRAAAELSARGVPSMGAATAEAAVYHAHCSMLRVLGCKIERSLERVFAGVRVDEGARVVLHPSFAPGMAALRLKLLSPSEVSISRRSTLVVEGSAVTIRALKLDGALVIRVVEGASLRIESLEMHNKGWSFIALTHSELTSAAVPEVERMRGYRLQRDEELAISLTEPGSWVFVDNQLVREESAR